jgi:hypothetical protein
MDKYVSALGSTSLFPKDQLAFQQRSLEIQQKIAKLELDKWIIENKTKMKAEGVSEEEFRNLQKRLHIEQQIAQTRKDWEKQGFMGGVKEFATQQVIDSQTYLAKSTTQFLQDMKSTMSDQLSSVWIEFANTGALNFQKLGEAFRDRFIKLAMDLIVNQLWTALSQVLMQALNILGVMGGGTGGGASLVGVSSGYSTAGWGNWFSSAHGNIFHTFDRGGIVTKPTLFPMADGMGLMGEAGYESVMPLTRTASGDLGVRSVGGDTKPQVTVIVNNNSSKVDTKTEQNANGDVITTIDDLAAKAYSRRGALHKVINAGSAPTRR